MAGSDEKMRRMWLGREIVVAGLPPLDEQRSLLVMFQQENTLLLIP